MASDEYGTICKPDCSRCTQAAWAWANVSEYDGYGNSMPPSCEDIGDDGCPYCMEREPTFEALGMTE